MSKKITGFSLDEDVVEAVKELAKKDDRTLSNYINILLANHIKATENKKKPVKKKNTKLKRRRD
jgi:hypothetical protein